MLVRTMTATGCWRLKSRRTSGKTRDRNQSWQEGRLRGRLISEILRNSRVGCSGAGSQAITFQVSVCLRPLSEAS